MAAYRFWRLYFTQNNGEGFTVACNIQLRDSMGVNQVDASNPLSTGIPYASSQSGDQTPDKGFRPWSGDASGDNYWSTASGAAVPSWIAYEFFSPVDIRSITMTGVRASGRMPRYFIVQASDDGITWHNLALWGNQTGWALGGIDTRSFDLTYPAQANIGYMLQQPAIGGYSDIRITLNWNQPLVDGYSVIREAFQLNQPLIDGYSVIRTNFQMVQALFPVLPEPPMSELPFPGFGNSTIDPSKPAAADPFHSALPGLSFSVHKKPMFKTNIKEAASGQEVRNALMQYPRWDFELEYEFLEDRSGAESSLKTIMGFFMQMQGAFDTFLFKDPDDYLVTNTSCGVGDGVTTQFPLLRNLGGFYELIGQVDTVNPIVVHVSTEESTNIPVAPGPYTIVVTEAASFVEDLGVIKDGSTPMVKVSGPPAAGQYSVDVLTGTYTFNATDQNDPVVISYRYSLGDGVGYTIAMPNHIVFDTAPDEGVLISASFQFFFACRFVDDQMDFEKFMDKLWNLRQCNFRSVIQ